MPFDEWVRLLMSAPSLPATTRVMCLRRQPLCLLRHRLSSGARSGAHLDHAEQQNGITQMSLGPSLTWQRLFQAAVVDALVEKTLAAAAESGARSAGSRRCSGQCPIAAKPGRKLRIPGTGTNRQQYPDNAAYDRRGLRITDMLNSVHDFSFDIEPNARFV